MKRLFVFTWLMFLLSSLVYSVNFDEWNIWHAVDSVTLTANKTTAFGPIYMANHEVEFTCLVYGVKTGDSLKTTINIYGMMSPIVDDTLHMTLITTTTDSRTGTVIVIADTLAGNEMFPFLYGKVTNNHADSSAVYDVYIHSRLRDVQTQ